MEVKMNSRYSAYKDSGVEWLGEIPEHWDVKRLKYICSINPSKTETKFLSDELEVTFLPMESIGVGIINPDQSKKLVEVSQGFTFFANDDVVIAKITPCFENGKGAIVHNLVNGIGFGTTELHILRASSGISNRFLYYLTASYPFRKLGEGEMQGTAGQKRVTGTFISNFTTPFPSIPEQHAIANFLDRETARIDALIAKYQRLIELLEEKRASLISQAVTKGLDASVEMKDSGEEWLGKIPGLWMCCRLKYFVQMPELKLSEKPDDYIYLGLENIEAKSGRLLLDAPIEFVESSVNIFRAGDVLFGKLRPYLAKVGYPNFDGVTTTEILTLTPKQDLDGKYLFYLMLSEGFIQIINSMTYGTKMPRANSRQIGNMNIPIPSLLEQRTIAFFLDQKTTHIDTLKGTIIGMISRLQEYRTAIVSALVTGKIDVR